MNLKHSRRSGQTSAATMETAGGASSGVHHSTPNLKNQTSTPVYSANGRVIGEVCGATFYKWVKASIHFLRQPPAIAFDIVSLHSAAESGAELVEVLDTESGRIYRASISNVWANGRRFDRGFGQQIFLVLSRWSVGGRPPDAKPRAADVEAEQMVLV
jgi:hypothetical protein